MVNMCPSAPLPIGQRVRLHPLPPLSRHPCESMVYHESLILYLSWACCLQFVNIKAHLSFLGSFPQFPQIYNKDLHIFCFDLGIDLYIISKFQQYSCYPFISAMSSINSRPYEQQQQIGLPTLRFSPGDSRNRRPPPVSRRRTVNLR